MAKQIKKYRSINLLIIFTFFFNLISPGNGFAQIQPLNLPQAGSMVGLSQAFAPALLKGVKVFPNNPFRFDFIVTPGDQTLSDQALKEESQKMIKYFLATLTVPEKDLWVNLSPYEENRIIPEQFGQTEMGRDLLAQDYLLKQITASLIYPEKELGAQFWKEIYEKAYQEYGTTNVPINTFNKVWIVPDKARVYENGATAFVIESHLQVMLEEDYLALDSNRGNKNLGTESLTNTDVGSVSTFSSDIVKKIVLPTIEKEVNEGQNFAQLRQIYNAMILATWFKKKLRESILDSIYVDKNKVVGVDSDDKDGQQQIYEQYIAAFKQGVYNYIKEDYDPYLQASIPRKYFSGGFKGTEVSGVTTIDVSSEAQNLTSAQLENQKVYNASAVVTPVTYYNRMIRLLNTVAKGKKLPENASEDQILNHIVGLLDQNGFLPTASPSIEQQVAAGETLDYEGQQVINQKDLNYKVKVIRIDRGAKETELGKVFDKWVINHMSSKTGAKAGIKAINYFDKVRGEWIVLGFSDDMTEAVEQHELSEINGRVKIKRAREQLGLLEQPAEWVTADQRTGTGAYTEQDREQLLDSNAGRQDKVSTIGTAVESQNPDEDRMIEGIAEALMKDGYSAGDFDDFDAVVAKMSSYMDALEAHPYFGTVDNALMLNFMKTPELQRSYLLGEHATENFLRVKNRVKAKLQERYPQQVSADHLVQYLREMQSDSKENDATFKLLGALLKNDYDAALNYFKQEKVLSLVEKAEIMSELRKKDWLSLGWANRLIYDSDFFPQDARFYHRVYQNLSNLIGIQRSMDNAAVVNSAPKVGATARYMKTKAGKPVVLAPTNNRRGESQTPAPVEFVLLPGRVQWIQPEGGKFWYSIRVVNNQVRVLQHDIKNGPPSNESKVYKISLGELHAFGKNKQIDELYFPNDPNLQSEHCYIVVDPIPGTENYRVKTGTYTDRSITVEWERMVKTKDQVLDDRNMKTREEKVLDTGMQELIDDVWIQAGTGWYRLWVAGDRAYLQAFPDKTIDTALAGDVRAFSVGKEFIVGRGAGAELLFANDDKLSGRNFSVQVLGSEQQGYRFQIQDLKSKNGIGVAWKSAFTLSDKKIQSLAINQRSRFHQSVEKVLITEAMHSEYTPTMLEGRIDDEGKIDFEPTHNDSVGDSYPFKIIATRCGRIFDPDSGNQRYVLQNNKMLKAMPEYLQRAVKFLVADANQDYLDEKKRIKESAQLTDDQKRLILAVILTQQKQLPQAVKILRGKGQQELTASQLITFDMIRRENKFSVNVQKLAAALREGLIAKILGKFEREPEVCTRYFARGMNSVRDQMDDEEAMFAMKKILESSEVVMEYFRQTVASDLERIEATRDDIAELLEAIDLHELDELEPESHVGRIYSRLVLLRESSRFTKLPIKEWSELKPVLAEIGKGFPVRTPKPGVDEDLTDFQQQTIAAIVEGHKESKSDIPLVPVPEAFEDEIEGTAGTEGTMAINEITKADIDRDRIKKTIKKRSPGNVLKIVVQNDEKERNRFKLDVDFPLAKIFQSDPDRYRNILNLIALALDIVLTTNPSDRADFFAQANRLAPVLTANGYHKFTQVPVRSILMTNAERRHELVLLKLQLKENFGQEEILKLERRIERLNTIMAIEVNDEMKKYFLGKDKDGILKLAEYIDQDFIRDVDKELGVKTEGDQADILALITHYLVLVYQFEKAEKVVDLKYVISELIYKYRSYKFSKAVELGRVKRLLIKKNKKAQWRRDEDRVIGEVNSGDYSFKVINAKDAPTKEAFARYVRQNRQNTTEGKPNLFLFHQAFFMHDRIYVLASRDNRMELYYSSDTYSTVTGQYKWKRQEAVMALFDPETGEIQRSWYAKPRSESAHDLSESASAQINQLIESKAFAVTNGESRQTAQEIVNWHLDLGLYFDPTGKVMVRDPETGKPVMAEDNAVQIDFARYPGWAGKAFDFGFGGVWDIAKNQVKKENGDSNDLDLLDQNLVLAPGMKDSFFLGNTNNPQVSAITIAPQNASSEVGGIDLNPENLELMIQNEGPAIKFDFDPEQIKNLQFDGFLPIIMEIKPVTNLPALIGKTVPPNEEQLSYHQETKRVKSLQEF